jgi:hypothetical protein
MNNHSHLVNSTLLWLGKNCPHIRVWKNPTGQAYSIPSVESSVNKLVAGSLSPFNFLRSLARISFGSVGQADITGIISPTGQRLEIEIKTGTGRQSEVQKNWENMIKSMGGKYVVVRSLDDLEQLKLGE